MAPPISKETATTLIDTLGTVKSIDGCDKKIQAECRKTLDGMRGGIDDSSADEIELYRPRLAKVVDDIDNCLNSVQGALGVLVQLRADKALMEEQVRPDREAGQVAGRDAQEAFRPSGGAQAR